MKNIINVPPMKPLGHLIAGKGYDEKKGCGFLTMITRAAAHQFRLSSERLI